MMFLIVTGAYALLIARLVSKSKHFIVGSKTAWVATGGMQTVNTILLFMVVTTFFEYFGNDSLFYGLLSWVRTMTNPIHRFYTLYMVVLNCRIWPCMHRDIVPIGYTVIPALPFGKLWDAQRGGGAFEMFHVDMTSESFQLDANGNGKADVGKEVTDQIENYKKEKEKFDAMIYEWSKDWSSFSTALRKVSSDHVTGVFCNLIMTVLMVWGVVRLAFYIEGRYGRVGPKSVGVSDFEVANIKIREDLENKRKRAAGEKTTCNPKWIQRDGIGKVAAKSDFMKKKTIIFNDVRVYFPADKDDDGMPEVEKHVSPDLQNNSVTYQEKYIRAVDGVDMTLREGEIFCLLGHNGAGKSTLIHAITGLVRLTSGNIQMFGKRKIDRYTHFEKFLKYQANPSELTDAELRAMDAEKTTGKKKHKKSFFPHRKKVFLKMYY